MMYHINKHGVPAICKAEKGKCPLGGEHFDSQDKAQIHANNQNEITHGLLPKIEDDSPMKEKIKAMFPELSEVKQETVNNYTELEIETKGIVENLKKSSHEYMGTDEYFDKVQETRLLALEKYKTQRDAEGIIDREHLDKLIEEDFPPKEPWKRDPNYQFHPEISDSNFNYGIGKVISAYTGKPIAKVRLEIEEMRGEGNDKLSLQEATRQYWNTSTMRTDKPIISVDLETANPRDKSLEYDNGQLTYIIEFGANEGSPT